MSTTQRVVRKQLAGAEDILQGVGTVTQTRGSGSYPIHKLDIPIPTYDIAEMQASSSEFMRLYGSDTVYTDYRRNHEGSIGISSNLGGVWEPVGIADFVVAGSFSTGAYAFTANAVVHLQNAWYRWKGTLPKIVPANSTPSSTGGVSSIGWELVTNLNDTTVRDELLDNPVAIAPKLTGMYLATELDITGTTDESATIAALWSDYNCIKLPKGKIRANINVPSGCTLLGSGQQGFDRLSLTWDGNGTLLLGSLDFTGKKYCAFGNLSIDTFALGTNAVAGVSANTEHIFGKQVTTRANNHGHLWEQNGVRGDGRDGGYITIEDCIHYGGPNGFVTKMRDVNFIRCKAYDVTVQAFVVVADNINGQGVFSIARNCNFIDCSSDGCNITLRIYSRNYHDGIDTLLSCRNIRWIRGAATNYTSYVVRIGDPVGADYVRLLNEDIYIDGGSFVSAPYAAILAGYVNRLHITGSPLFYANGTNVEFQTEVYNPHIDPNIAFADAPDGAETRLITATVNATTVLLTTKPEMVRFANTATTNVVLFSGLAGVHWYKCKFIIDDDYTSVTATGVLHKGKGTVFEAYYNGTTWVDLGEPNVKTEREKVNGSAAAAVVFDFHRNAGARTMRWDAAGVSITGISLYNTSNVRSGDRYALHIINSAATDIAVAGWPATIKWADGITALSTIAAYKKVVIELLCIADGGTFVVTSKISYT